MLSRTLLLHFIKRDKVFVIFLLLTAYSLLPVLAPVVFYVVVPPNALPRASGLEADNTNLINTPVSIDLVILYFLVRKGKNYSPWYVFDFRPEVL